MWICYGTRSVPFTVPTGRRGRRDVYIQQQDHQKDLNLCVTVLLQQGHCWIGKKHTVLVIWPSSTLKCLFVFDFNICLSYLFLKFGKFLVLYLGCSCATFNFTTQRTLRHLIPRPMNKKLGCKDHQIYSKMLRKFCEKEV